MNAEIGAYQAEDGDDERQGGLVIDCDPPRAALWSAPEGD